MGFGDAFRMFKKAFSDFFGDDCMTLAAALAYYTALSLAPLLVLMLWAASFMGPSAQDRLVKELVNLVGPQAGQSVQMIVENAKEQPDVGKVAGIISLGLLLFSAAAVFGQLQASLNRVWNVKAKPKQGIWAIVRKRLLSFGMIFAVGFLLLVSLAVSAALSFAIEYVRDSLPGGDALWQVVNFIVPLIVIIPLFALIFEYLPDVRIGYRDVWIGAAATGVLFAIGKMLIGLYLGQGSVGSSYGAAGSLIVLLVWVFYSSCILFFGAELTQAWTAMRGHPIEPSRHAIWADHCEPGQEQAPRKLEMKGPRAKEVRTGRRIKARPA